MTRAVCWDILKITPSGQAQVIARALNRKTAKMISDAMNANIRRPIRGKRLRRVK